MDTLWADPRLPARFWTKIDVADSGCWLWTASRFPSGYAQFWWNRTNTRAHRTAYRVLVGGLPADQVLDHTCRVIHCVNPAHLDPVTNAENIRRGERGVLFERPERCTRGHLWVDTLRTAPSGDTYCLSCNVERARERRARKGAGPANEDKTHCPADHEYTPENTYITKRGVRQCRECNRLRCRARRAR